MVPHCKRIVKHRTVAFISTMPTHPRTFRQYSAIDSFNVLSFRPRSWMNGYDLAIRGKSNVPNTLKWCTLVVVWSRTSMGSRNGEIQRLLLPRHTIHPSPAIGITCATRSVCGPRRLGKLSTWTHFLPVTTSTWVDQICECEIFQWTTRNIYTVLGLFLSEISSVQSTPVFHIKCFMPNIIELSFICSFVTVYMVCVIPTTGWCSRLIL